MVFPFSRSLTVKYIFVIMLFSWQKEEMFRIFLIFVGKFYKVHPFLLVIPDRVVQSNRSYFLINDRCSFSTNVSDGNWGRKVWECRPRTGKPTLRQSPAGLADDLIRVSQCTSHATDYSEIFSQFSAVDAFRLIWWWCWWTGIGLGYLY